MTVVREARSSDLGHVIMLLLSGQRGTEYEGLLTDAAKMAEFLSGLLDNPAAQIFVLDSDGRIDGVLFGSCQDWWFGPDLVGTVMMLYAEPSARSGVFVKRMVEMFETWAASKGAAKVLFGVSSGVAVDRKDKLLKHFGYKAVGGLYAKDVV